MAIVGKSDVGKTTLRKQLAKRLQWTSLAIDEYRQAGGSWETLMLTVYSVTYPLLIESIAFPPGYRRTLHLHDSRVLEVRCEEQVRLMRGGKPDDRAYDYDWPILKRVDTTHGDVDIDALVEWCKC